MATIERTSTTVKRSHLLLLALGLLAVGAVVLLIVNLRRPPQIDADEAVFNTVDALFTALTAHDEKRLGQCEQRLHVYRDTKKLPDDASDFLDGVIRRAREGRWQSAAESLYDFVQAQQREGADAYQSKRKDQRRRDPGKT
jgi:hypothetical protein